MTFTVPGIPPSYNQSFKIAHKLRQVYLSKDAKNFKKKVMSYMPQWSALENYDDDKVKVDLEFHDDWYYKNGKMKKKDVQNLDKLVIDAVFQRLGIDDSRVWVNSNTKIQSKEPSKTVITLEMI